MVAFVRMQSLADRPALAAKRARLLELLRSRSFQEREVVLSSGRTSNFYIDCKQVSLDAEGATLIGELFHAAIEEVAPQALAVGGLTLGADPPLRRRFAGALEVREQVIRRTDRNSVIFVDKMHAVQRL